MPDKRPLPVRITSSLRAISVGFRYLIAPNRFTLRYPEEYPVLHSRYRGFIVLDHKKCIGCASCARICPASAMKMFKLDAKTNRPIINYQRCISCGLCVDVCPVEALRHVPVHDIGYYKLEELKPSYEEFQKEPVSPAKLEGGVPIEYLFDPNKGLVKKPVR